MKKIFRNLMMLSLRTHRSGELRREWRQDISGWLQGIQSDGIGQRCGAVC